MKKIRNKFPEIALPEQAKPELYLIDFYKEVNCLEFFVSNYKSKFRHFFTFNNINHPRTPTI